MKRRFTSDCALVQWRVSVSLALCLGGVFLALAGLGQNAKDSARQIDPANPCNPERKFCGRLHIEIQSAGSTSGIHPYTKGAEGVDADLTDVGSNFVYSNFHQFRRNDESGTPSYSIVLSSDAKLQ